MKSILAAALILIAPLSARAVDGPRCETRLLGNALQVVLEKGLDRHACSLEDLVAFAANAEWYNPFERLRATLVGPTFITAFNELTRTLSAHDREEAKLRLKEFLREKGAMNETAERAAKATEEILALTQLPAFDISPLIGDSDHSSVVMFEGRPIIVKPARDQSFATFLSIIDPFNPDPTRRTRKIEGPKHRRDAEDAGGFELNGETYVFFEQNNLFYNLTRGVFVERMLGDRYVEDATIVRTSEGPMVFGTFDGMTKGLVAISPDSKPEPIFRGEAVCVNQARYTVNRMVDRDIIVASDQSNIFIRDLSGRETFDPIAYRKDSGEFTVDDAIFLFEDGDRLLAAVPLIHVVAHRPSQALAIIDVRQGKWLHQMPIGSKWSPDFSVAKIRGQTLLLNSVRSIKANHRGELISHRVLVTIDPATGELRETNGVETYDPFKVVATPNLTLSVSADKGKLVVYDHTHGTFVSTAMAAIPFGHEAKVFTYLGIAYAVVDNGPSDRPVLIQLTAKK